LGVVEIESNFIHQFVHSFINHHHGERAWGERQQQYDSGENCIVIIIDLVCVCACAAFWGQVTGVHLARRSEGKHLEKDNNILNSNSSTNQKTHRLDLLMSSSKK